MMVNVRKVHICVYFRCQTSFFPSPGWYVLYLLQWLHHVICMQPTHRLHTALNRSPSTIVSRSSLSPIVLMSPTSCPGISFTFLTCSKCRWILVSQFIIFSLEIKGINITIVSTMFWFILPATCIFYRENRRPLTLS